MRLHHTATFLSTLACLAATALTSLPAIAAANAAPAAASPNQTHVAWSRNANIYEVNVRQFTPEGTLKAFATHLPRLKKMGVDIIWLMPIQPIGELNRKGTLGSYYAVRDYKAVNPEFGTLEDLRALVKQAHGLGMRVILDWVANHTAWDNVWVKQHNDWYQKNEKGEIFPVTFQDTPQSEPEYWTDVVALDYKQPALWNGMIDAMAYWVREADIDGFRCDVADLVPVPFWNQARIELDKIKPMFMLAEGHKAALHDAAFDMSYAWVLADVMKAIGAGKATARDLQKHIEQPPVTYPASAYRMTFTSNHDFNSWHGHDGELYGPAYKAMAVLAATLPGMPLIYGGQEAGLAKRLEFFEKDAIQWNGYPLTGFYTNLLKLKKQNPALWNGQYGGAIKVLDTGNADIFAFSRIKGKNVVSVMTNLSAREQTYRMPGKTRQQTLPAWGWKIIAP